MDPVQAGQLATLCGVTNIVSRASGGWASDQAFRRFGIKVSPEEEEEEGGGMVILL